MDGLRKQVDQAQFSALLFGIVLGAIAALLTVLAWGPCQTITIISGAI